MPWSGSRHTRVAHSACVSDDRPQPARKALAPPGVQKDGVEGGSEHVVLTLVEGAVPDPHGPGTRVPGQVVESRLREVAPPVDPVHDLQPAVVVRLHVGDELHELVGLPVEVQVVERLERERRVADPGVAVVPVPLASRGLGKRGGECRHRRSGRHVRQPLDRQGRALDRVAPAMVGDARPVQPGPPEAGRRREALLRLVRVDGYRKLLGPREGAVGALALLEDVPCPHPAALDPEREVRLEADRLPRARRVRRVPAAVDQRPRRRLAAVAEDRARR